MIHFLYNELLYRPILNSLAFLYNSVTFRSLGLSIIILTIIIRIILIPISIKMAKHQKIIRELQPHLEAIKKEHKDNKTKQTEAVLELYKAHGIKPVASIFLPFVQLLFLIPLYTVFNSGLTPESLGSLYPFVVHPGIIDPFFLGINLTLPNTAIILLAAVAQYFQGKLSMDLINMEKNKTPTPAESMVKYMVYLGPVMTLLLLWSFPSAIGLYWLTGTVFLIIQQALINKHLAAEVPQVKINK